MKFEQTLLGNLLKNETYSRKVIPHLNESYFKEYSEKQVFSLIDNFVSKYNLIPSKESLLIELENIGGIKEREYEEAKKVIEESYLVDVEPNVDWLVDKTETWCKDAALYNAILESVQIIDGGSKDKDKGCLPQLLSDALAVTFDTQIGHDLFEDADSRFDYYHREEEKIKFDISWLNTITNNGIPRKTLNCILAPMNAGKSLLMCSMAAHYMRQGLNVVYITMEMAEERIAERIDSNLMMMSNEEIKALDKKSFQKRMEMVKAKTPGKLVIKEYPTAGAHAGHFRHLLNELSLKKKFKADVVFVDYMNICLSQRVKGGNANSYTIVKSISEELRGLAVEKNLLMWTATQTTRAGVGANDLEMGDVSESIGVAATCDFIVGWIRTPELDENRTALMKQIKNRFGATTENLRCIVGVNYNHMTVYDLDIGSNVTDDGYVVSKVSDKPNFSREVDVPWNSDQKPKKDFASIKF